MDPKYTYMLKQSHECELPFNEYATLIIYGFTYCADAYYDHVIRVCASFDSSQRIIKIETDENVDEYVLKFAILMGFIPVDCKSDKE